MMNGLRTSQTNTGLRLDPRSKLFTTFTMGLLFMLGGTSLVMEGIRVVMSALPLLLFLAAGKGKRAAVGLIAYGVCSVITFRLLPYIHGAMNLMLAAICVVFLRFMPIMMMAWYMFSTTTVGEIIAAMEKLRLPPQLIIPLSVVFRFMPTVQEECSSINDAMRMRGIQWGGGKVSAMLEYRVIPMMMCSVKIGEELSAAALTRGLGAPGKRTNICTVCLRSADWLVLLLCVGSLLCLLFERTGVF